jgi:hypothetical protein
MLILLGVFHERRRWSKLTDGLKIILWGLLLLTTGVFFADTQLNIESVWYFLTFRTFQEGHILKLLIFAHLLILTGFEICLIVLLKKYKIISSERVNKLDVSRIEMSNNSHHLGNSTKKYSDAFWDTSIIPKLGLAAVTFSPLIIVYAAFVYWKTLDYKINTHTYLLLIFSIFSILIVMGIALLTRKYLLIEIIIKPDGILFQGLFRKVFVHWDEIQKFEQVGHVIGEVAIVNTKQGNFYFRPTMKNKAESFPILKKGFMGGPLKWVAADGSEKQVSLENCELFVEIKKRIISN